LALDLFAVALSAALLIACFPPFPFGGLAWIALLPLFLALRRAGAARGAALAYAAGLLLSVAHGVWLPRVEGIGIGTWLLMHAFHATYFAVFGALASLLRRRLPGWDLVTWPGAWVLIEYLRLHSGFLSFPWPVLAYSQWRVPAVAEVATVAGMWGVSFLLVSANAGLAELVSRRVRRRQASEPAPARLALGGGALIASALLLAPQLATARREVELPTLRVAIVQAGVWTRSFAARGRERVLEDYRRLTAGLAAAAPALVAWPEAAAPGAIPGDFGLVNALVDVSRRAESYLLVGASGQDKSRPAGPPAAPEPSNTAFLFTPEGRLQDRYDKIRLLPFNEYLPLRGWVPWPKWLGAERPDARSGSRTTVFDLGSTRFGVLICWENLFPDGFRRQAAQDVDFIVSMTNESFVPSRMAREQFLAFNAFRAIENRIAVVRAASTGVSAIIAPDGRVVARLHDERGNDVDAQGTLVGDIPLGKERTFYTRHGDWFVAALAALAGAAAVRAVTRAVHDRDRSSHAEQPAPKRA
jgi:apolipoprotein N-acyltransferase